MDAITGRGSKIWEKLAEQTAGRGKTQWPKSASDLEKQGVRFDYDGTVEEDGQVYHKYQVQLKYRKDPQLFQGWKEWRDKHGGTDAVIGTVKIKQGASMDEVDETLKSLEEKL